MSRICVIDGRFETPVPPFIQEAFETLGHETVTVFASTQPRAKLERELEDCGADLFVAIENVGFLAGDILSSPCLSGVKKAVLFYDDPMTSYLLFGRKHPFVRAATEHHAHFFIWDGYWRKKMREMAGWKSAATHLAAETKYFSPGKKDPIPGISHCVVFLGNIPSMEFIQAAEIELPSSYRKAAVLTRENLSVGVYGLNPFEALDEAIRDLPGSDQEKIFSETETYLDSVPDLDKPLAPHARLRKLAWQLGKRETRLRAMRAASRVAPLAILSDLKPHGVAGKDELIRELRRNDGREILFIDTSNVTYYQLASLYSSGLLHLQSTDPQSVDGGIPYRVFQCAACAAPLVSDYKKELAECFTSNQEIIFYKGEHDLGETLMTAISNPSRLREIGKSAYERFLKEHTWTHRMKAVLKEIGPLD